MYGDFASVYDRLMRGVDYGAWATFYGGLLSRAGVRAGKVCECACGTGGLTLPLARMGYQMTGVDLSPEMLWIASQKARAEGLAIPFVRQDMRALRLHRQMDAVLATCDGVNYLLRDADAEAFFQAAHAALRPGGALAFDVSTVWKLEHALGDRLLGEDLDDVTYLWQNAYDRARRTVAMALSIFVRQPDGRYARIDEEQKQRGYAPEELEALLRAAGFGEIRFWGENTYLVPSPTAQRIHVTAVKPEADAEAEWKGRV